MTFVKGQSGNPSGRPKVKNLAEIRELAQSYAPAAIEELGRLMKHAKTDAAKVAAIQTILDRGYGKALQTIDMTMRLDELPDHEIDNKLNEMMRSMAIQSNIHQATLIQ
ncbi:MAG TPA: DUF5681 domain-containing protein [Cyclobacteriaceae bacterium]